MADTFREISSSLVVLANSLHSRGWLLGTSGNLSAVAGSEPLRLAITPSGADKGELTTEQILLIDEDCNSIGAAGKPSDESPLHVGIVKALDAGAVIHTHSVWSTVLSDVYANENGFAIEGYEMLKGLKGVTTHQHREWIPILENSQDMTSLAETMNETLAVNPDAHAFILRRHGLYTWGGDIKEAKRHVEILEFLFETSCRSRELSGSL